MTKRCVKWFDYRAVALDCKGDLLAKISSMPQKNPIELNDALKLLEQALREPFEKSDWLKYRWLHANFNQWISDQGFHIEITGDEFESYSVSQQVA